MNQLLNKKPLEKKLNKIGDEIKHFKNEYYTIKEKDYLDPADNALLNELEDQIIKLSMSYNLFEDQYLYFKDTSLETNKIKKGITSIELPVTDLPLESIKNIFTNLVIIDQENYVLVISAKEEKLTGDQLKKTAAVKPLLESRYKGKNRNVEFVNWKIIII